MPWVPRELYDVMVDALRAQRGAVSSSVAPVEMVEAAPVVVEAPLPRAIEDACEHYAFGDPIEHSANRTLALQRLKQNRPLKDIVAEIRQGGPVELYV